MNFDEIHQFTEHGDWECSYSTLSFIKQIELFEKEDSLILNPDFQRGHVWTEDQQVKYVEFILQGGKTGRVIYLNDPNWKGSYKGPYNEFVCVDGLQRVTALKRFFNNEIKVLDRYYEEFEGNIRNLKGMSININNLKTKKEVLQWYLEMNEGGTPHSKEELQKVKNLIQQYN